MNKAIKIITGISIAAFITISCIISTNLILKTPHLSGNDLYLLWLIEGSNYFITPDTGYARKNLILQTNPELRRLDNYTVRFKKEKEPGTFRVFCVGGSTTRGWPFHKFLSYPQLMSQYLKDLLPNRKVEIINAGFHAFDSFNDLSLVKELVNYNPDLILLYEGRNEEFDMPIRKPKNVFVLEMHTWLLKHVYVYSYIKSLYDQNFNHAYLFRNFTAESSYNKNILSETFLNNLQNISNITTSINCQLILLTQILHDSERQNNNNILLYNQWIKEFAKGNDLILIDLDKAFLSSKIPEEDMIIPSSVHPDLKGYCLMARTICEGLYLNGIIAQKPQWHWDRLKDDPYYLRKLGVTNNFLSNTYHDLSELFHKTGSQVLEERYRKKAVSIQKM